MLKYSIEISNLKELQKYVKFVKLFANSKTDIHFQKYLKDKVLSVAEKVTNERLFGGTTNDEAINLYKRSHHIKDIEDGFILYNDAQIVAETSTPNDYPDGLFSIALAFEFGVGIQGLGSYTNDYFQAWEYDVSRKTKPPEDYWYLPTNKFYPNAQVLHDKQITFGYDGFEIYRHIMIEIDTFLPKWVNDYYSKREVLK